MVCKATILQFRVLSTYTKKIILIVLYESVGGGGGEGLGLMKSEKNCFFFFLATNCF